MASLLLSPTLLAKNQHADPSTPKETHSPAHKRIGIIGAGTVGSSLAFSLLLRNSCHEIILYDISTELCTAQAADLADAQFLSHVGKVTVASSLVDIAARSDVVVITAGARQTAPGQSRLDLMEKNVRVIKSIVQGMGELDQRLVLVIVSNPVDVLTGVAGEVSGLPRGQVIGSGTFLDSMRLRNAVGEHLNVSSTSLNTMVYGEHGESQFVDWANASHNTGVRLNLSAEDQEQLAAKARNRAAHIIRGKGSTGFGVASTVTAICESILIDKRDVQPVSLWHPEFGCALSLPAILGNRGAEPVDLGFLEEKENALLEESAKALRKVVEEYAQ